MLSPELRKNNSSLYRFSQADLISKNGTLGEVEDWGKKKLAYPINYEADGYYVLINFSSEESFPAELDRVINITDGVLRSLIVAKGE